MSDTERNQCPNCGTENQPNAHFCRKCGTPLDEARPALVEAEARAAAGALNAQITSITDPLLRMIVSSPDELIIASLKRVLDESGPRQAEVLRRCAIPRWLDLAVLAVLREREDGNERVLELLLDYSFVRDLGVGRYTYHDTMREALLKEWRELRPDDLRAINLRLADHFHKRGTAAASWHMQTSANKLLPNEQRNGTHEALYHHLMADSQVGMMQLEAAFAQAEAAHNLAEAETLIEIASDAASDRNSALPLETLWARLERISQRPALRTDTPSTVSEVRGSETQDEVPPSAARAHLARTPSLKEPVKAQPADEGYELFRRAIAEHDPDAWAEIAARYRPLLVAWANRAIASANIDESADAIADQALARAWTVLTPERFAKFPTLARLLKYLHTSVTVTVVDNARARGVEQPVLPDLPDVATVTLEEMLLADPDHGAFWRALLALAATPAERIVLVESLAYGFPPRTILARHPQLFANVAAVYNTKRNLFTRLQRNRELLRLAQDLSA